MEINDIISDAYKFPANNFKAIAIYIVLSVVAFILFLGGLFSLILVGNNSAYLILTAILFILALCVGLIMAGFQIDLIKTGIDLEDIAPDFDFKNDLVRGIKNVIVSIVYYIIPAIITLIIAFLTNVPGQVSDMFYYANQTVVNTSGSTVVNYNFNTVPSSITAGASGSLLMTVLVGIVLFIIFAFLKFMANARLAKTDSLGEALNIPEAFRDISKIGYANVIGVVLIMVIIFIVINGILMAVPFLAILNIIVSPYLMFAMARANGLLYSEVE